MAAEPWCAPVPRVQTLCLELGLGRDDGALVGDWWNGPALVLFVDGAHDGLHWRMGGFTEQVRVRSEVAERLRSQSQQLVELHISAWGVRLVSRLGYTTVTLSSDSEVAIAELLTVRAKSALSAQQKVLRGLVRTLMLWGLVVWVLWVPSDFQLVDPLAPRSVHKG